MLLSTEYGRAAMNDIHWVLMIFTVLSSTTTPAAMYVISAESLISMIETVNEEQRVE